MSYGRPLKGNSRRIPVSLHVPLDMLDAIDAYVKERRETEGVYSRSEFYTEAAKLYLEHLQKGITNKLS